MTSKNIFLDMNIKILKYDTILFTDQKTQQPSTSSVGDTNLLVAAVSFGKSLRPKRPDMTGPPGPMMVGPTMDQTHQRPPPHQG